MTPAYEKFKKYKPVSGYRFKYRDMPGGVIVRVEGNLCWAKYDGQDEVLPFIWAFKDGLNKLHDWPTKMELV